MKNCNPLVDLKVDDLRKMKEGKMGYRVGIDSLKGLRVRKGSWSLSWSSEGAEGEVSRRSNQNNQSHGLNY